MAASASVLGIVGGGGGDWLRCAYHRGIELASVLIIIGGVSVVIECSVKTLMAASVLGTVGDVNGDIGVSFGS